MPKINFRWVLNFSRSALILYLAKGYANVWLHHIFVYFYNLVTNKAPLIQSLQTVALNTLHIRIKRNNKRNMSSLFILADSPFNRPELHVPWQSLFVLDVTTCSGRHYLFWPSLFVLAVTICSDRHYLFWPLLFFTRN